MGIKWTDLSLQQKSMIEGLPSEPTPVRPRILRRPRLECDEQRVFANWLRLNALPHCWHATHKPSTATIGTFDFWVGKDSKSVWIEFKIGANKLSPQQDNFKNLLSIQKLAWYVVPSADEAIRLIKEL
jgi:hypothetical protein